ncbi:Homeobox protein Nkx-2.1 [Branchiostoma belcheri]|nr:Homeobox protein Nkx-2.1 [Branchiostoma belcheri]
MASPSKKRKRLDSQGSLADTSDVGSGDGGYTRDSHDIVVNKSRVYKKKQMKNLQMKLSAETSDKAGEGKTREKKNKDAPPTLSGQSKDVNGGTSNNSAAADGLPMSPSKGSSGTLLRRKYRRERTSSQSSTGTDHGITSLSQMEYFPLSGQEKKHSSTCTATEEEDKSIAPRNSLQTNSENRSVSEIFPWIPKSQSSQESQPPIHLDADGLLVQEDTFKKPLDPVKSSPSKYSSGLVGNVSTVQSGQEGSDNEKRHKKKKKKKREKDKDVESSAAEEQATNVPTVQSGDDNSESEVPESDVGSPVKSPLAVPRRHAIENNKANTTGNASKDKPKSSASKLPVWCIEDAGQESQAVSEVFDMFGWGQNKSSSLGSKHSSQGMIRTTSTQPNFDTVVGKGRGTSAERKEKDQSHDDSTVAITPQKKSRLSRKGKQKSREQQNSVDDSVMNNTGTHDDQPLSSENTGDTAKENTLQESVDEVPMTSKLPSESAGKNVTDRRKRTKKDVLEEAESSVDKEHAEKRRKMEKENVEENPEEAQDQVVTDNKDEDEDSDSSGEDFEDAVPSSSTTRSSPRIRAIRESRKRRAGTSSTGDAEDMWLKGVQALSAEDVQELKEKGVTIRFGHFSRREKAILKKNMESFCEMHGVEDNRTLLFPHQYPEKKNLKKLIHESGMFRHLAQGLNRPLWNVYTKARYMFSNPEKSGKFSPEDDKLLLRLYKQHGPRWARISRSMGRFEDHIKQRFLYMKGKGKNRGAWSAKENKMLIRAVQTVTGQEDISNVTQNINWQACSDMMNTVRGAKQCYEHWLVLINWLSFQQGSPIWNPERDAQLIDEIYKSEAEFDYDIDWQDIAKNMDWLKHHMQARRRFRRLKLRVPDCDRQDMDGILDYLKEGLKKKVQEWMKTKEKRASLPRPAKNKESAKVDNTGSTSKAGHDNKSDVESSDDSDDDSKTEVDTSDEE